MNSSIRILICEDHGIVRKGIRALLATEPNIQIVGEAENGAEAVEQAAALKPDVILMDLVMPELDGIEATRRITAARPEAHILVLTSFAADDKVFPAIKAGALGYLLKDSSPDQLVHAIQQVARGEPSLEPEVARKLLSELHRPSDAPSNSRSTYAPGARRAAFHFAGIEQPRDRRSTRHHRADRVHPRQQHPCQAAPGQPHASCLVCAEGGG